MPDIAVLFLLLGAATAVLSLAELALGVRPRLPYLLEDPDA